MYELSNAQRNAYRAFEASYNKIVKHFHATGKQHPNAANHVNKARNLLRAFHMPVTPNTVWNMPTHFLPYLPYRSGPPAHENVRRANALFRNIRRKETFMRLPINVREGNKNVRLPRNLKRYILGFI
jgi:hypothetical protein